jgi:hypothetical protein
VTRECEGACGGNVEHTLGQWDPGYAWVSERLTALASWREEEAPRVTAFALRVTDALRVLRDEPRAV